MKGQENMATRGSYVHNSMAKFSGASRNLNFMQFSLNIDGFRPNDSQGLWNSCNSINKPIGDIFHFTIYQNYTLALIPNV